MIGPREAYHLVLLFFVIIALISLAFADFEQFARDLSGKEKNCTKMNEIKNKACEEGCNYMQETMINNSLGYNRTHKIQYDSCTAKCSARYPTSEKFGRCI